MSNENTPNRRERRLRELEETEREQDRRREMWMRNLRAELSDRRVQRGIEALIRARSAEIAASLSETHAAQLQRLALRLSELDLLDLGDDPGEEIAVAVINDLKTGEVVTAIDVGESMYWEAGRELIEQQERSDGLWRRRLGDDGQPVEDWRRVGPPPPSRAAGN